MSIDRCIVCEALIDTDYAPEVYREDQQDRCICDNCYIPDDGLQDLDDEDPPICSYCNGSGEGMYDGSICGHCKGSGVERNREDEEDAACSRADALNDARDES